MVVCERRIVDDSEACGLLELSRAPRFVIIGRLVVQLEKETVDDRCFVQAWRHPEVSALR